MIILVLFLRYSYVCSVTFEMERVNPILKVQAADASNETNLQYNIFL